MANGPVVRHPGIGRAASGERRALGCFTWLATLAIFVVGGVVCTTGPAVAGAPAVALYVVGDVGQYAGPTVKQHLEAKGYAVTLVQGEPAIEKHIEKIGVINRSSARVFLAFEFVPSEKVRLVTVVETRAKKGEGSFLTVDEVPGRFNEDSHKLAYAVAEAFNVRAKQMPLFPLLGVNMPGIFIRWESKEVELPGLTDKLAAGLEKYLQKDKNL
jgi:hypothetical protein